MKRKFTFLRGLTSALALCCCLALSAAADGGDGPVGRPAEASAELPAEPGLYCFSREELDRRESLEGVFLTGVPAPEQAELLLGSRVLRAGDAVSRSELSRIRVENRAGGESSLSYLPYEDGRLGEDCVLTFHLERSEDEPPVALDGELETWRNLPNKGQLKATDDGDGPLRYTLTEQPRRGSVELAEDGSFTYSPQKNKVGEDSFRFTVSDEAGNVSAPATVKVTIRRPTDAKTFADLDRDQQFEALWLRETGLFGGETVSERLSFGPEQSVSRGDFLAMVMDLAGIDPEIGLQAEAFADGEEAAAWLRPYLASALRRGLVRGERGAEGLVFRPNEPVTRSEAAALCARLFDTDAALPASFTDAPNAPLTRLQAAKLLYEASKTE
ncbi:MAG: S-layer homology domain-containing protein [Oscillospiraceae bacterium]|nr:S-layer homology domain-containing protein [Oscillospiraceae bacterium]